MQAEKILSTALTAKRQPSRRLVLNSSCFIRDLYRDSSPAAQNDSVRREDSARNVGSFLRKELGEALRIGPKINKDLTPLSSVACGATPFLRKGAFALRHAAMETQKSIP